MKPKKSFSLFATAFLLLSFIACKKNGNDDSNPANYVKFKMDGNWITWTTAVAEVGSDLGDDSKTNLGFTANSDDNKQVFDITVQVDATQIKAATYSSEDYFMPIDYVKNANGSDFEFYSMGSATGRPDSKYILTVTAITDKEIKGRFSGNYLVNNFTDDDIVEITEGEFVVKRIR